MLEIAGDWYRDLVREHEDDPGVVEQWEMYQDLLSDAADEPTRSRAAHRLSKLIRIDPWLEARGYNLDQETREKVLPALSAALFSGAETIKRRAEGDYGSDEKLRSYPVSKRNISSNELRGGGGLRDPEPVRPVEPPPSKAPPSNKVCVTEQGQHGFI